MKKFLPMLAMIIIVLASFVGGAHLATYRTTEILMNFAGRTAIQDNLNESLLSISTLDALYKQDYSHATLLLESQVSAFIQNLDTYSRFTDESTYESICSVFHHLHQQRQKEPGLFFSISDGDDPGHQASLQSVNEIINKWSKLSCDQPAK